jgi:hypothetical protein
MITEFAITMFFLQIQGKIEPTSGLEPPTCSSYEFAPLGSTKGEIFGFPRLRALMTPTATKSARRRW